MSLKDCIRAAQQDGHLTLEEAQALERRYDELARHVLSTGRARELLAAELAAEALERKRRVLLTERARMAAERDILQHRNKEGDLDPAAGFMWLHEHQGQAKFKDIETARQVILAGANAKLEGLLYEFRKGALTGDKRRKRASVKANMAKVVDEIFGEDSGDAKAKELAGAWTAVAEDLRQRSNAAGSMIGKLDYGYIPQRWSQQRLLEAGPAKFIDDVLARYHSERMKHLLTGEAMTREEVAEAARVSWERITTDGWIDREPAAASPGKGAVWRHHSHERFLHFKDAKAWREMQELYGDGDVYDTMMGHIAHMSRDIAAMERLGPNPAGMREYLKQVVDRQARVARAADAMLEGYKGKIADIVSRARHADQDRYDAALQRLGDIRAEIVVQSSKTVDGATRRGKRRIAELTREADAIEASLKEMEARGVNDRDKALAAQARFGEIAMAELSDAPGQWFLNEFAAAMRRIYQWTPELEKELVDTLRRMGKIPVSHVDEKSVLDHARWHLMRADQMWDVQRGSSNAPVSAKWASRLQAARNVITASSLGTAVITAASDAATQSLTRGFVGMERAGVFSVMMDVIKALRTADRREAVRAGLILDSALAVVEGQARYGGSLDPKIWSGYIADRVLSISGLSPWTQAGKHAFGLEFMAEMAQLIEKPFVDLPDGMRRAIERHGLSAVEWNRLRTVPLHIPEQGVAFLRPAEIEAAAGRDLAEKYLAMILRERQFAVVETNVRSRALTMAGTRPGTLAGELIRTTMQFKSFPVQFAMMQASRMAQENAERGVWSTAKYGAGLVVGMTALGALSLQLKELVAGKDPRPMNDPKFWGAALMQSGALGIYGDVVFQDVNNRYSGGTGFIKFVGGPLTGRINNIRETVIGKLPEDLTGEKESRTGRFAERIVRDWTPGRSIWFLKLGLNRWIFNEMQKAVDPNAHDVFRRWQQMQKRESGNEFFWAPGQREPARAPRFDRLLQ